MKQRVHLASIALPMRSLFRAICWLVVASAAAGCAGVVVVDTAFEVRVSSRDETGKSWRASTLDIIDLPLDASRLSPFPDVRYRGDVFEWIFESSGGFLGGRIRSLKSGPVCFLFDEARLSSNWRKDESPLRVFTAMQFSDNTVRVLRQSKGAAREAYVPPQLCFPSDSSERFIMSADTSTLFPDGRYFNIQKRGDEAALIDRGIGNWIKLQVPIEFDGKREELDVTLTVKDSQARRSYH